MALTLAHAVGSWVTIVWSGYHVRGGSDGDWLVVRSARGVCVRVVWNHPSDLDWWYRIDSSVPIGWATGVVRVVISKEGFRWNSAGARSGRDALRWDRLCCSLLNSGWNEGWDPLGYRLWDSLRNSLRAIWLDVDRSLFLNNDAAL